MYVLEIKNSDFLGVYLEIQPILDKLGLVRKTFERNMKSGRWETDVFVIRKATFSQKRSGKGNKKGQMSYFTGKNTSHSAYY
jgi:hypothetical protein